MGQDHLKFMKVYQFDKKVRLGIEMDGGYVIADLSGTYDCYVSAGVGREESFSKEFIQRYGMNEFNSFGIDSSIEGYPIEYTNSISFIKKNISNINDAANTNLRYLTGIYNNIFLKMDIEGGEYNWIRAMTDEELNKFRQIVIEVHGINNDSWGTPYEIKKACLKQLYNTHYLVHAHGNNARGTTNYIPNVFELTYIRKSEFSDMPMLNMISLPDTSIDFPNNINRPDYPLNMKPFTNK
jgi:hypothetical protein